MRGKRKGKVTISSDQVQIPEFDVLNHVESPKNKNSDTIELKKELGLVDGCAIILGVIIGAGIFVSPKGVLLYSGSPGVALIVWVLSGLLCMVGALCYAELGTMLPRSGGEYAYMMEAFGELPAFLFMWTALIIIVPTGNAILALTFAYYLLQPMWTECDPPDLAVRLLSAAVIGLLTAVNCYNVKWGANLQTIFTATKMLALVVIIIAGMVVMFLGDVGNLQKPFEGTITDPGSIALAFYSGLFSFAGWNYLNFVTEELKDPFRNLPRAIWISLPMVTLVYTLANLAYFAVLTPSEILDSNAVAVSFGDRVLGPMAWIIPVFVACSTFGSLNGSIFAASRLLFVGARQGHLPKALALININTYTPIPALVFIGALSVAMLITKDVYILINYVSFVEALAMTITVLGLLWLRYKQPDTHRPIKMPIFLPIAFFIICVFLIFVPIFTSPASEIGAAIVIVLSGIPVYLIFVRWKGKPKFLHEFAVKLDRSSALFFMGVQEESSAPLPMKT